MNPLGFTRDLSLPLSFAQQQRDITSPQDSSSSLPFPAGRLPVAMGSPNRPPMEEIGHHNAASPFMLPTTAAAFATSSRQQMLDSNATATAATATGDRMTPLDEVRTEPTMDRKRKASFSPPDKQQQDISSPSSKSRSSSSKNKKPQARINTPPTAENNAFPLPALDARRTLEPCPLISFHGLWSELEDSELQEELFRQRLYRVGQVKIVGKSRSIRRRVMMMVQGRTSKSPGKKHKP